MKNPKIISIMPVETETYACFGSQDSENALYIQRVVGYALVEEHEDDNMGGNNVIRYVKPLVTDGDAILPVSDTNYIGLVIAGGNNTYFVAEEGCVEGVKGQKQLLNRFVEQFPPNVPNQHIKR